MTFPQQSADQVVPTGQQIFRINTTLACPGDTYQSTQSGYGFSVGPNSDIARVAVNYWDPSLAPTFMNQAVITPGCPLIADVQCRNDQVYLPANVPGRVIFSPLDVVPQLPANQQAPANVMLISPVLDIIQYLENPPSALPGIRADKRYNFVVDSSQGYVGGDVYLIFIPIYGRRRIQVTASNITGTGSGQLGVHGIIYQPGYNALLTNGQGFVLLADSTNISSLTAPSLFTADANGQYDYLELHLAGDSVATYNLQVIVSDQP